MMKAETLLPMDLELNILNENTTRTGNQRNPGYAFVSLET
jgi:hypothetical protein